MAIVFLRTVIIYFTVVFIFRFVGKKQIGEMQPGELVLAMMLSDLATVPMQSLGNPLTNGLIPIFTLMIIEVIITFVSQKSIFIRKMFTGSPSLLVNKGKIEIGEMKKMRINIDDLYEQLRSSGYMSVSEVEYAILETNGQLSVVPKSDNKPVTLKDLKIKEEKATLPRNIIKDGHIDAKNLQIINKDEKWLKNFLRNNKIKSEKEVFIFTSDGKNDNFIQRKDNK